MHLAGSTHQQLMAATALTGDSQQTSYQRIGPCDRALITARITATDDNANQATLYYEWQDPSDSTAWWPLANSQPITGAAGSSTSKDCTGVNCPPDAALRVRWDVTLTGATMTVEVWSLSCHGSAVGV